jgi:hypothetical protein
MWRLEMASCCCRFKEDRVNSATKTLINVVEKVAEEQDRDVEDVMKDLMQQPGKLLPVLFTAENMKQFMPEALSQVRALDLLHVDYMTWRICPFDDSAFAPRQCESDEAQRTR